MVRIPLDENGWGPMLRSMEEWVGTGSGPTPAEIWSSREGGKDVGGNRDLKYAQPFTIMLTGRAGAQLIYIRERLEPILRTRDVQCSVAMRWIVREGLETVKKYGVEGAGAMFPSCRLPDAGVEVPARKLSIRFSEEEKSQLIEVGYALQFILKNEKEPIKLQRTLRWLIDLAHAKIQNL